jgi:type IX secretion system PorP/SprF family membrane protein
MRIAENIRLILFLLHISWVGGVLCPFSDIHAQQLPLYSQYSFNAFLLNPAVAGAEGYTSVNLTAREQWMGVEGAPRTFGLSVQTRLMKRDFIEKDAPIKKRHGHPLRSGRIGLGLYIYNDQAGLINQTGMHFTYAYHIHTNKSQLSLGITFSLLQYMINTKDLNLFDKSDDQINSDRLLVYIPDFNIGAYYTDEHKYLGLSILQIANSPLKISNYSNKDFQIYRHFYLTSGYKFELDEVTMLEPSIYLKTTQEFLLQMDATIKYIYNKKFWVGFGYRTGYTFIGSLGVCINRFYAGYSYDYNPKGLNITSSSHELMLTLKLGDNVRRYKWIERY